MATKPGQYDDLKKLPPTEIEPGENGPKEEMTLESLLKTTKKIELSPVDAIKAQTAELAVDRHEQEVRARELLEKLQRIGRVSKNAGMIDYLRIAQPGEFGALVQKTNEEFDRLNPSERAGIGLAKDAQALIETRSLTGQTNDVRNAKMQYGESGVLDLLEDIKDPRQYLRVLDESVGLHVKRNEDRTNARIGALQSGESVDSPFIDLSTPEAVAKEVKRLEDLISERSQEARTILSGRAEGFGRAALTHGDMGTAIASFDYAGIVTRRDVLVDIHEALEALSRSSNPTDQDQHNKAVAALWEINRRLAKQGNLNADLHARPIE